MASLRARAHHRRARPYRRRPHPRGHCPGTRRGASSRPHPGARASGVLLRPRLHHAREQYKAGHPRPLRRCHPQPPGHSPRLVGRERWQAAHRYARPSQRDAAHVAERGLASAQGAARARHHPLAHAKDPAHGRVSSGRDGEPLPLVAQPQPCRICQARRHSPAHHRQGRHPRGGPGPGRYARGRRALPHRGQRVGPRRGHHGGRRGAAARREGALARRHGVVHWRPALQHDH